MPAQCKETGKRRFKSKKAARKTMRGFGRDMRVYRCKYCGDLHATKRDSHARFILR